MGRRSVDRSVCPTLLFFCKVAYRVACARLMAIGLVSFSSLYFSNSFKLSAAGLGRKRTTVEIMKQKQTRFLSKEFSVDQLLLYRSCLAIIEGITALFNWNSLMNIPMTML